MTLTACIISFLSVALLFYIIYDVTKTKYGEKITITSSEDIWRSCEGLNVKKATECLIRNVAEIYKYNSSQVGKELTFEELKENGGVCNHYSMLYTDAAQKLGFYARTVTIKTNNTSGHMFTVVSNHDAYCIIDSLSNVCFEFAQDINK